MSTLQRVSLATRSGLELGTVYSYTVVHREFASGVEPPYVAALVEPDEQAGLRLLTNLVNCSETDLAIGMPVRAVFHDIAETSTLLFFEPARGNGKTHAKSPD